MLLSRSEAYSLLDNLTYTNIILLTGMVAHNAQQFNCKDLSVYESFMNRFDCMNACYLLPSYI